MISILMPIYNGIEFIDESVNSIIEQTFEDWELLIGINGHPENSNVYLKAKKFENEKIKVYDFFNIKNKSDTLNELIKYTKYDWISLLDVDDIWLPNKLYKQFQYINNYDIIGTNCHYFEEMAGIPFIPYYNISNFDFTILNPIINSSVLLKKDLCYWNREVEGIEDYELWLKLRKQEKKFYNISDILVRHRIHKSSSFNTKNNDEKIKMIIKKYT